ncbi:hypothetical protein HDU67_005930 [Dinochytrium kinnereticum]|nr:hypothetical protein HDU67_005930 [Dinochytrium kinnereticum]
MVRLAKKHLSTLEELWGEVSGVPMSPEARMSLADGTPTRRMLKKSISSPSISAHSLVGLDDDDNPFLAPVRGGGPTNDKALVPIIEALERLIAEEMDRRRVVEEEIKSLKTNIHETCEHLAEPVRFYINAETVSKTLTIFQCRDALKLKLLTLEKMSRERQTILDDLTLQIEKCRKELVDLADDEYILEPSIGLSLDKIRTYSEVLETLYREKELRQHHLTDCLGDLTLIFDKLGYLKDAPGLFGKQYGGDTLFSIMSQILTIAKKDMIEVNDGIDTIPPVQPSVVASDELSADDTRRAARILLTPMDFHPSDAEAEATILACVPPPFDLSKACARFLKGSLEATKVEFEDRLIRCRQTIREIQIFWQELGVPENHVGVVLNENVKRLEEYQVMANELRGRWRQRMEEALMKRMDKLKGLWKRCHVSEEETERFTKSIAENFYSPLTLETIDFEISKLEERLKREKPLLELIEDRYTFIQKLKDFERSASDPQRLFQPSFRLLEEEKFRKTGVPTLLSKEEKLRRAVLAFEHSNYPFSYEGARWLEVMDREIGERFVNEALVVFDSTLTKSPLHRQNSHASPSPRPSSRGLGMVGNQVNSTPSSPTLRRARSAAVLSDRSVQPKRETPSRPPSVASGWASSPTPNDPNPRSSTPRRGSSFLPRPSMKDRFGGLASTPEGSTRIHGLAAFTPGSVEALGTKALEGEAGPGEIAQAAEGEVGLSSGPIDVAMGLVVGESGGKRRGMLPRPRSTQFL